MILSGLAQAFQYFSTLYIYIYIFRSLTFVLDTSIVACCCSASLWR